MDISLLSKYNIDLTCVYAFTGSVLRQLQSFFSGFTEPICKVPYRQVDDPYRYLMDTLPLHMTITYWPVERKREVLELLYKFHHRKVTATVSMPQFNKTSIYFVIEPDTELRELLRHIHSIAPNSLNPEKYKFHITVAMDNDEGKIRRLAEYIRPRFKPVPFTIDTLYLFTVYPARLVDTIILDGNGETKESPTVIESMIEGL